MALASTALSQAKAKFEVAQSEGDWVSASLTLRDALSSANEALVAARRANDAEARLDALDLVAQCNMYLDDMFAANLAVSDELAMIKRTGDKRAETRALQIAAEVHTARGDDVGAVDALQEALKLTQESGDGPAQAKTLRELAMAHLTLGKHQAALAPAQDALKLYQELGDEAGEKEARRALNRVFAAKNQLEKAPDRPQALEALKELTVAIQTRNSLEWGAAMDTLNRTGAYTQKDLDDIVEAALERDRTSAAGFLQEQGLMVEKASGEPQMLFTEHPRILHYLGMRVGGLGYGPRFRCGHLVARKEVTGDEDKVNSAAVLQVSHEADTWETELQYHPGVLDSMLQSSGLAYPGLVLGK